jgi:hypothetical protein
MRSQLPYWASALIAVVLFGALFLIREHERSADARRRAAAAIEVARYKSKAAAAEAAAAKTAADADAKLAAQDAADEKEWRAEEARVAKERAQHPRGRTHAETQRSVVSSSPLLGEPGSGMTVERARAIAERVNRDEAGTQVKKCDRKAEDVVECAIERKDNDGRCLRFDYIKQPTFQSKMQMANGPEYCTMRDGYSYKLSDGDPTHFSTLLDRWYH